MAKNNIRAILLVMIAIGVYFVYKTASEIFPNNHCSYRSIGKIDSPKGISRAYILEENCGATTGFSYIVGVAAFNEKFNNLEDYFFSKSGANDIIVTWNDENNIVVTYGGSGKIFRKATIWRTYQISYNEKT